MDKRPPASSPAALRRMKNTRRRDTDVEVAIRRRLHARGLRYRVDAAIPGVTRARPDIVFPRERVAVFIDGCFWHRCPIHGTEPNANRQWWKEKLDANVARDRRHDYELAAAGWHVLRLWEHEDVVAAADAIAHAVIKRRGGLG